MVIGDAGAQGTHTSLPQPGDPQPLPSPLSTPPGPAWPQLEYSTLPSLARPLGAMEAKRPSCGV